MARCGLAFINSLMAHCIWRRIDKQMVSLLPITYQPGAGIELYECCVPPGAGGRGRGRGGLRSGRVRSWFGASHHLHAGRNLVRPGLTRPGTRADPRTCLVWEVWDSRLTRNTAVLSDPMSFRSRGPDPLEDTSSRKESCSRPVIGKRNTGFSAILEADDECWESERSDVGRFSKASFDLLLVDRAGWPWNLKFQNINSSI